MKVPLLDLKIQYREIKEEVEQALRDVFDSQQFILGPKVQEFEKIIADYCNCKYAVGVSSGTDAILISLMAEGITWGDYIITTPYTFFATAGAIARVGATPIFVDIEPDTYNMDPDKLEELLKSLKYEEIKKIKAIVPIHLFGQCADMEPIINLARKYDLSVIEDSAQAIGSLYRYSNGEMKKAGSIGDYGAFSFFPSKNLGGFGDGGMVVTNDEERYNLLKILRVHGANPKYYHAVIGGNFRLDAIQATILIIKSRYLDKWTDNRIKNAETYKILFESEGLFEFISLPIEKTGRHVYNQFVIRVEKKRDELKKFLFDNGIGTEIYYPVPLHLQECFKHLGYKRGDFPVSEMASETTLALPVYPELTEEQIIFVVKKIKEFIEKSY